MAPCTTQESRAEFWQALSSLDRGAPALRETWSARWIEAGRAEHASIASFSAFSLDLLRFGAPPDLLRGAHEAALDEIEHARICFALGSHYAGKKLGPGPLALARASYNDTLSDAICAAIEEGCISETVAAAEARSAVPLAPEGPIRLALHIISEDETRHGELAWSFVAWALASADNDTWQQAEARFEQAVAAARRASPDSVHQSALQIHGKLSASRRAQVREEAFENAILPAWQILLTSGC